MIRLADAVAAGLRVAGRHGFRLSSGLLNAGGCSVERSSHGVDLLFAERAARKRSRSARFRFSIARRICGAGPPPCARLASAMRARRASIAGRLASRKALPASVISCSFLPPSPGADRHVAEFLKQGQRRIDHTRAGAVGAADLLLDRLDDFVTVARFLGDEVQDDQAQVAMGEEAAESGTAAATAVPAMANADGRGYGHRGRSAGRGVSVGVDGTWASECVSI